MPAFRASLRMNNRAGSPADSMTGSSLASTTIERDGCASHTSQWVGGTVAWSGRTGVQPGHEGHLMAAVWQATAAALGAQPGDRVTAKRIDDEPVHYVVVGIAVVTETTSSTRASTSPKPESTGWQCRAGPLPAPTTPPSCAEAEVEAVMARTRPGADRSAAVDRLADAGNARGGAATAIGQVSRSDVSKWPISVRW
jgi:hypothetical protein